MLGLIWQSTVFYVKRVWGKTTRGSIDTNRAGAAAAELSQPFQLRQLASTPSEEDVCCAFTSDVSSGSALVRSWLLCEQPCDLGWRGQELETQVVEIKADSKKWSRKSFCTSYIFMELRRGPSFQRPSLLNKQCYEAVSNWQRHNPQNALVWNNRVTKQPTAVHFAALTKGRSEYCSELHCGGWLAIRVQ